MVSNNRKFARHTLFVLIEVLDLRKESFAITNLRGVFHKKLILHHAIKLQGTYNDGIHLPSSSAIVIVPEDGVPILT
jgi:hypothetical protein